MHKQDVENATMTAGIGLPLAGWLGGAHLAQMPFAPFPDALRETIHQTLQNPIMASCTVASVAADRPGMRNGSGICTGRSRNGVWPRAKPSAEASMSR